MSGKYDDIIHLPHPDSPRHPRMPVADRAAQFSPFAALTGYSDTIRETARLTDEQTELSDEEKSVLDGKQQFLLALLEQRPEISVTYFRPDSKKQGGAYRAYTGILRRIDETARRLIFADKSEIAIEQVADIQCALFGNLFD